MSIASTIKILGGVALVGLLAFASAEHGQAVKFRKLDALHQTCVQAVHDGQAAFLVVGKVCDQGIASAQYAALAAGVCDQALDATPENAAALRQVCSSAVKTVVAERDVARTGRDDALSDLKITRDGQAAAITRAEARIRTETQRKIDAAKAVASAPRDAAGLVSCDAVCLLRRAGQEP